MRRKKVAAIVESEQKEQVVLSDEDIDKVLGLIKSGKSLKQIGEILAPPAIKQDAPLTEPVHTSKRKETEGTLSPVPPAIIQKIEIRQVPVVDLKIDWLVDNKRYSLGATRPLPENMDLKAAHEQLYGELLISMDNLVELTKEAKDTPTK